MTKRPTFQGGLTAALAGLCLVLAGCSEKPQTMGPKADSKAWEAPANGYGASGYKAGDQAAWEEQMRKRAQHQNEYSRAVAAP